MKIRDRKGERDRLRAMTGGAKAGTAKQQRDAIIDGILGIARPREIDRHAKRWTNIKDAFRDLTAVYGGTP